MRNLTDQASKKINDLAQRYEVSNEAVIALLEALERGKVSMAQFDHPELGGQGQWMQGGMTMLGEMSNDALKTKINNLCDELSKLLSQNAFASEAKNKEQRSVEEEHESWWPKEFGPPDSSGGQNDMSYAYFAKPHRLVVKKKGRLTVYDTLEHQISGVSQQQQSDDLSTLKFSSQLGEVALNALPIISSS